MCLLHGVIDVNIIRLVLENLENLREKKKKKIILFKLVMDLKDRKKKIIFHL